MSHTLEWLEVFRKLPRADQRMRISETKQLPQASSIPRYSFDALTQSGGT